MKIVFKMIMIVVIATMVFALREATHASAKAKKVSEPIAIKNTVLSYDAKLKQQKPLSPGKVKFGPIKIVSGWAKTTYNTLDSKGRAMLTGDSPTYILHKVKGQWRVAMKSELVAIDVDQAKKIGLPWNIGKKLEVVQWWD